jgi:predicted nucleic acid-binding protein
MHLTILVDTSGVIAARNKDDADHDAAKAVMRKVLQNQ